MMKLLSAAAISGAFAVSGCVAMATREASTTLADRCEEYGENTRIRPGSTQSSGGMFGAVTVTGECLSPEEEGYEDAMTIDEYRASIGRKPD